MASVVVWRLEVRVVFLLSRLLVYFTESAKYASSAVIRLRRSDFIEARYAFSFVFANFGIAIAAKMPMITTTIKSSISVKPLRFIYSSLEVIRYGKKGDCFPTDSRSKHCAACGRHHLKALRRNRLGDSTVPK